jgi:nucleoside phosphorylase
MSVDLLLLTVNRAETRAILGAFERATGRPAESVLVEDRVYRNLGSINGTSVFHALSEMGSASAGAALQTVEKGIKALDPGAVIAVGVAFGVNENEQVIGDILISRQLRLYDAQRVGHEVILRGDRPHASTWLINYFEGIAQSTWPGAAVHVGTLFTGEKLLDSLDYRSQLLEFDPEAVGGEMEGAGLYVASQDSKVDWIVIKAICDWGDGEKATDLDARQRLAAENAAEFVVHSLRQVPLRRRSPSRSATNVGTAEGPPAVSEQLISYRRVYYEGFDDSGDAVGGGRQLDDFWLVGSLNAWTGKVEDGVHHLANLSRPDAPIHNSMRYSDVGDQPIDLGDCRVSVRVRVAPPNDAHSGAGLLYRANADGDSYFAFLLNAGASVTVAQTTNSRMRFIWSQELATDRKNEFVLLTVTGRGSEVDFAVDGVVVHTLRNTEWMHGNPGAFALSLGNFYFDDFALYLPVESDAGNTAG